MDDAKIGHDIRERAYALMRDKRGLVPSDADLGRAAREVLAKPEATREAVQEFLNTVDQSWRVKAADLILSALSHFAPPVRPKMMIETMADDDAIRIEMVRDADVIAARQGGYNINVIEACARVAHRLANTPAPEHDPDAEAKRVVEVFRASGDHDYPRWDIMDEGERDGWRAVAAAKKEAEDWKYKSLAQHIRNMEPPA